MRIFCSICKDIFIPYSEVHVTNCGHLYHGSCISTWIKQHRTCPQCRTNVSQPFRVYFDVEKENDADPSTLEHQVETLSDKLRETERLKNKLKEDNEEFEIKLETMKEFTISLSKKNDILKTSVKALKEQVTTLSKQNEIVLRLENEVELWKNKVSTLERVETLIKGSVEEVNKMIETTPVTGLAVKHLCTYVGIMKVQLKKIEAKNFTLIQKNKDLTKAVAEEKKKQSSDSEETIKNLKATISNLEEEIVCLKKLCTNYKKNHLESNTETDSCQSNATQSKKSLFDLNFEILDEESENKKLTYSLESDKTISHWEDLVCAGPSKNFGLSLKKSRSFSKSLHLNKDQNELSRSNSTYVFDGLGGRKKLRLGGPTPLEEFENIKKNKDKKCLPNFQHKKIIEYYQVE